MHHKALWRRPDKVKRKARDERDGFAGGRSQYGGIRWVDHRRRHYSIGEGMRARGELNEIVFPYVAQITKKRIAMRGECGVARRAWIRGTRNVPTSHS